MTKLNEKIDRWYNILLIICAIILVYVYVMYGSEMLFYIGGMMLIPLMGITWYIEKIKTWNSKKII